MMKGKARAFQAAAKALLGLFAPIAGSAIVAEGGNGMDSAIIFVTPAKFDLGGSFGHRSIFQKKRRNGRRRRPPDRGQAARAMSAYETTPTRRPSPSSTGAPEIWFSIRKAATSCSWLRKSGISSETALASWQG